MTLLLQLPYRDGCRHSSCGALQRADWQAILCGLISPRPPCVARDRLQVSLLHKEASILPIVCHVGSLPFAAGEPGSDVGRVLGEPPSGCPPHNKAALVPLSMPRNPSQIVPVSDGDGYGESHRHVADGNSDRSRSDARFEQGETMSLAPTSTHEVVDAWPSPAKNHLAIDADKSRACEVAAAESLAERQVALDRGDSKEHDPPLERSSEVEESLPVA